MTPLVCRFLGRVAYGEAQALQDDLVVRVRSGDAGDTLLLLEHPPVITLGRGAKPEHVLVDDAQRREHGVELHEAGRGGDVTFHGPGQLVGYPILALREGRRDAHGYLRALEEGLIATVAAYGVEGGRVPGLTGVWVGGAKIAAIGVRLGTGWITSHGFSLNVGSDVSGFDLIVPCGIGDKAVTSLALCCGRDLALADVARTAGERIAAALGYRAVWDRDVASEGSGTLSSPPVEGGSA